MLIISDLSVVAVTKVVAVTATPLSTAGNSVFFL
jgi:hypothetical protein